MALSIAAIKRLPVGTKLTLVNSLMGPCRKTRTVHRHQSNALTFTGEGIESESYLHFNTGDKVKETTKGFQILDAEGHLMAEYEMGHNPA